MEPFSAAAAHADNVVRVNSKPERPNGLSERPGSRDAAKLALRCVTWITLRIDDARHHPKADAPRTRVKAILLLAPRTRHEEG